MYFAGGLGCPLEYFHAGFRPRFEELWDVHSQQDLVAALWRNRTDSTGVLSAKLMWRDAVEMALEVDPHRFAPFIDGQAANMPVAAYQDLLEVLGQMLPNPTFVHLYRRDRIRQAVSGVMAEQTGQWRAIRGAEMARQAEPVYDADAISRHLAHIDFSNAHWRKLLAVAGSGIELAYEDLVRDFQGTATRLLRDLGSGGTVPPPRMERQANRHSEQFVLRYLMEHAQPG